MKLNVGSLSGKKSSVDALDAVFDHKYNEALLHEVVTSYRVNGRSGNSAQKNRSEVSGGGAKPWRQKGTGRARAGTSRSPIWRSGGVTFAAKKRDYERKINKKVYRTAMKVMLSELVRLERLVVVDEINIEPKTKSLVESMQKLGLEKTLFVTKEVNTNLSLAARNLPNNNVLVWNELNPIALLKCEKVCITVDALQAVEEWLS